MKKRLTYEAPLARDLSAFGASGQWPLGNCTHGYVAQNTCSTGTGVSTGGGDCNVGGTASGNCPVGFSPNNECYAGGSPTPGPPPLNCSNGSYPGSGQCGAGQSP